LSIAFAENRFHPRIKSGAGIFDAKFYSGSFRKMMDARIKSAHDDIDDSVKAERP
jgi:hypothetical protein